MNSNLFNRLLLGSLIVLWASCTDNNYDFSDIDSTVQVSVNNLIIPVNIDQVNMKSILDLDGKDNIEIIDGVYTYIKDGTFTTARIHVPAVSVKPATISRVNIGLNLPNVEMIPGITLPPVKLDVNPGSEGLTNYDFSARNISNDVYGLSTIKGDFSFTLNLTLSGVDQAVSAIDLNNFKMQLPKNLTVNPTDGVAYDATTGVLTINRKSQGLSTLIKVDAVGINLDASQFDAATHSLNVSGEAGFIGGEIVLYPKASVTLPSACNLWADIKFADNISINTIDGKIGYQIADVKVPDINITNLPDVLSKPGTNIVLADPSLSLDFTNSLSDYALTAQAGFSITAYHGTESKTYAIDAPHFIIPAVKNPKICFMPVIPIAASPTYDPNTTYVSFSELRNVLSGDGVPNRLVVNLTNPNLPVQNVVNFPLDHYFDGFNGTYCFKSPLEFGNGSQIIYSDKIDGWAKDIEDITVKALDVNLDVTTNIPLGVEFKGYPIDANGNRINNVTIEGATVNPNANSQHVTLHLTGEIRGLDGIEFTAVASAVEGNALNEDMNIVLRNIRPCVTGYYTTEL